jgi:hypothetical protein
MTRYLLYKVWIPNLESKQAPTRLAAVGEERVNHLSRFSEQRSIGDGELLRHPSFSLLGKTTGPLFSNCFILLKFVYLDLSVLVA